MRRIFFILPLLIIAIFLGFYLRTAQNPQTHNKENEIISKQNDKLSIEYLASQNFSGSPIAIEEELDPGLNYKRYLASYVSDGFKINGLLTVPQGSGKFPAIVFDHGYIPPEEYTTTERYVSYVDGLARAGYVVFKIDYRGNGNSEGSPVGAYFSPGYTIDTLNAAESLKRLSYVNPKKIGVWGHSMAGMIITRALVSKPKEFQAAVLWSGVVGSYEDIMREWWSRRRAPSFTPSNRELNANRPSRQAFITKYGEPSDANDFWKSISPKNYISNIITPIQLHHGEEDETVPIALSVQFEEALRKAGKTAELYTYPGADHNISSPSFELAMQRTIAFFDKYLK